VIIWDEIGGWSTSRWGYVSYIIDGVSYSWQGDTSSEGYGQWTIDADPKKFTDLRSRTSSGTGYILDFGSAKINADFKDALKRAYVGANPANKDRYALYDNNCGDAFNRAIAAVAGDLRIPKDGSVKPRSHGEYINNILKPYIFRPVSYPYISGGSPSKK
jgi:hypothetical protein